MPNYRRTFLAGGTFFFTLVTQRRRRLFAEEAGRRCLGEAIRTVQAQQPFEMVAVVLMPNYIHCNPVKHGLVRCPHAWPHSSFHRWVEEGYYRPDWLCECSTPPIIPPEVLDLPDTGE